GVRGAPRVLEPGARGALRVPPPRAHRPALRVHASHADGALADPGGADPLGAGRAPEEPGPDGRPHSPDRLHRRGRRPRRDRPRRAGGRRAPPQGDRAAGDRGRGLVLDPHRGRDDAAPHQVLGQLPERPVGHAGGARQRLRGRVAPQRPREARRGAGRVLLHRPERGPGNAAGDGGHPGVGHAGDAARALPDRARPDPGRAGDRSHRAVPRRRGLPVRQRVGDHPRALDRPAPARDRAGARAAHPRDAGVLLRRGAGGEARLPELADARLRPLTARPLRSRGADAVRRPRGRGQAVTRPRGPPARLPGGARGGGAGPRRRDGRSPLPPPREVRGGGPARTVVAGPGPTLRSGVSHAALPAPPSAGDAPDDAARRILDGLNPAQVAAVTHDRGPLLIVAGAGTGKTTVLTRRIAHLIASRRARPEEILALTFTDKAALEMEERVDVLVPYGYADVRIATFHAFGDWLLREHALELGLTPAFRVLNRAEQVLFLRARLFQLPLHHFRLLGEPTRHLQALAGLFGRAKDEDVSPEDYLAHAEAVAAAAAAHPDDPERRDLASRTRELAGAYAAYRDLMTREGLVDFGDQILLALRLLRERPYVLAHYQRRFRYILVDEFQDTNHAQFELVKLLAQAHRNVTVVGDDDQAIFRFRGASMGNILGFGATYPDARRVVLVENYRSGQRLLDAAYRLIRHNDPERLEAAHGIDKRLVSVAGPGPEPVHLPFDTVTQEADEVARRIADAVQGGRRAYRDFAILVRANADADPFLRSLNLRGIPWTFSGNQGLYGRPEVRLCITFLRAVAHPDD